MNLLVTKGMGNHQFLVLNGFSPSQYYAVREAAGFLRPRLGGRQHYKNEREFTIHVAMKEINGTSFIPKFVVLRQTLTNTQERIKTSVVYKKTHVRPTVTAKIQK